METFVIKDLDWENNFSDIEQTFTASGAQGFYKMQRFRLPITAPTKWSSWGVTVKRGGRTKKIGSFKSKAKAMATAYLDYKGILLEDMEDFDDSWG